MREIDRPSSGPAQIAVTHHGPGEQAVRNQTSGGGAEQLRAEGLFHESRKRLGHAARVIGFGMYGRLHEKQADKCDQHNPCAKAHPAERDHRNLLLSMHLLPEEFGPTINVRPVQRNSPIPGNHHPD
jgi:hypothetical protein